MNAPDSDATPVERLCERLDHKFRDVRTLQRALTHTSAAGKPGDHNERLEFLGDRVLNLIVAELLWKRFPTEPEGDLAKRHAALVRRETLAHIAEAIDLGANLVLSRSESESGGRHNPGLLSDACEAVIAALYLDGGLVAASRFVEPYWSPLVEAAGMPPRDPKTALQEWAQGRGLPLPNYQLVESRGPAHEPVFTIEVRVEGRDPESAKGGSKRAAEQIAASRLLDRLEGADA